MHTNTYIVSFCQARPSANACVTSGCLHGDRPARARETAMLGLNSLGLDIDTTD
jgi:hypothetical protein